MVKQAKKKKLLLLAAIAHANDILLPRDTRQRRWRVRPLNQKRKRFGRFLTSFNFMKKHDPEEFVSYTRLRVDEFNVVKELIEKDLDKRSCLNTITVAERLAITLSYLAQGTSMREVARSYLRGKATVSLIIKETCDAIWKNLLPIYMLPPTEEQWRQIQMDFYEKWNLPNCIGAIDGKHIAIQCPFKSGSTFFNYKHFFSINLMAICDADYKFTFVDIGSPGIAGDSGVFRNSTFGSKILEDTLNTPKMDILPGTATEFPCFFVADEAFPLRHNLMRPYPQKNASNQQIIFNYRLSRARRTIENTFGILASRWRILRRPIVGHPSTIDSIVKAVTVLHNFLRVVRKENIESILENEKRHAQIPGTSGRQGMTSFKNMTPQGSRNSSQVNLQLRNKLCTYLNSEIGKVPWQDSILQ